MATRTTVVNEYDKNGKVIGTRTATYETTLDQETMETLRGVAMQALSANRAYLNNATPTAAQNVAQIRLLTRQTSALIRVIFGQLEEADG